MKKWRFVSNQNSTIVGINDAGIETFTANMNRSLVREIIQNSLDAIIPGSENTVLVEFKLFEAPTSSIYDVENLHLAIKKCCDSNNDEPDAYKFFKKADNILLENTVHILRISDHNTIGLEGADTCAKGTNWSRLVKENGSSNKGQNSGGSFGIGKSAAFACSDLRTVFYSSKDRKNILSNFGVAKLVSFEDEKIGWTTGVGYYSEDDEFVAIPELAELDNQYVRNDSGTDVYIIGMHSVTNFKETFIQAVLLDFLVSLVKGKLIVKVQDEVIDKRLLPKYISELNPYQGEEIKDLIAYYHLLTSSDPKIVKVPLDISKYGKKFGFMNGDCTIYLKEGEGYNRKVLVTRSAGMRILEFNRISGSIEFTGILIIDGPKMNETFKAMEVPSHDAWEPGRCRGEEKYYSSVLIGIKRYIKEVVKECFGKVNTNTMDAIGASDFLPDQKEEEEPAQLHKNELSTRVKNLLEKTITPSDKKNKIIDKAEKEYTGGEKSASGSGKRSQLDLDSGTEKKTKEKPEKEEKERLKKITVKKRLICTDPVHGNYILKFIVPTKASKGKLEFILTGEQSDFELPIKQAKILSDNQSVTVDYIVDNKVYLNGLIKGESVRVEITVDFDFYCLMEVDYFENKK